MDDYSDDARESMDDLLDILEEDRIHDARWDEEVTFDDYYDRAVGQALLDNTVVSKLIIFVAAVAWNGNVDDAELLMTFIQTSSSLQTLCVEYSLNDIPHDQRPPLYDALAAQMVKAAGDNASLMEICVNAFCAPVQMALARLIETSSSICNLQIQFLYGMEPAEAQQIGRAFQSNTTLTTLELDFDCDDLQPIFESLYVLTGLESLSLSNTGNYSSALDALCTAGLCRFFEANQVLNHLVFGWMSFGEGSSDVWKAINSIGSLRRLDILHRDAEANNPGLGRLLSSNMAIHHLVVSGVAFGGECFDTWNGLGTNQTLNCLDVNSCEFDVASTKFFMNAISKRRDVKLTIGDCTFEATTEGDVVVDHVMHSAFNTVDYSTWDASDTAAVLRKLGSKKSAKIWERSSKLPSRLHLILHRSMMNEDTTMHNHFCQHLPDVLNLEELTLNSSLAAASFVPTLRKNGSLHRVNIDIEPTHGQVMTHQKAIRLIEAFGKRNQHAPELIREAASLDEPPLLVPFLLEAMQPVARMAPNTALTMALLLGDKIDPHENVVKRSPANRLS